LRSSQCHGMLYDCQTPSDYCSGTYAENAQRAWILDNKTAIRSASA
jgi:hypothetical protein